MSGVLKAVRLPATMGEWVQGWIGGKEALVSLVVDWGGVVELRRGGEEPLEPKAASAFALARKMCGSVLNGVFPRVHNQLPRAKGFATSTVDIAGVLAVCLSHAHGDVGEEELFSLCASIEPSDGIMFRGLALVDHLGGELIERLNPPPPLELLVIVPERTFPTSKYRESESRVKAVRALAGDHELAYTLLRSGLSMGCASDVAMAATISATLQQEVLPCEEWNLLRYASVEFGALGAAVAHSGSASALIFAEGEDEKMDRAGCWLSDRLGGAAGIINARVCGGGVSFI